MRDLEGKAFDLSAGNTTVPEDEEILLKFYYEQAALGRCLLLPESRKDELDQLGELVLSPSFLVKAEGKKPRAILHLSSIDKGVNQRLVDESWSLTRMDTAPSNPYALRLSKLSYLWY